MSSLFDAAPLTTKQRATFGVTRVKLLAFSAINDLWLRRKREGRTQADLAASLGKDEGWLSKNLKGPGNWTIRTIGEIVEALDGDIEIIVRAAEDVNCDQKNSDAYSGYEPYELFKYEDVMKGKSATYNNAIIRAVP
jgi:transcriptional regulator with XRE-family HTH domain